MKRSILTIMSAATVISVVTTLAACSSDDGATSSSSGGTSGATSGCDPAGSWEFATYQAKAESGTACEALASAANAGFTTSTYVFTKNADGTYTMTEPADADDVPVKLTLDEPNCTLKGTEEPTTLNNAKDLDGKTTKATLTGDDTIIIAGTTMTLRGTGKATAEDATAKGFPCDLEINASGTKK